MKGRVTKIFKQLKAPLYPFLFASFTVLFYASRHYNQLTVQNFFETLVLALATSALFFILLWWIKDRDKRSLAVWLITIPALSYTTLKSAFEMSDLADHIPHREILEIVVPLAIIIVLFWLIWRSKQLHKTMTGVLTIAGIFLIASGLYSVWHARLAYQHLDQHLTHNVPTLSKDGQRPDIYFLLFDEYTGPGAQKKLYNFDDSGVSNDLKTRGFYVADKSTANYYGSLHSIASLLNMDYFDALTKNVTDDTDGEVLLQDLIENNATALALKKAGYTYYHLGSWWEHTRVNRNANQNLYTTPSLLPLSNFTFHYIEDDSIIGPLVNNTFPQPNQQIVKYQIKTTKSVVTKLAAPKFVFTHFMLPHEPIIYDAACKELSPDQTADATGNADYVNQVKCTNTIIRDLVDSILKNSKTPPIIIVQSDEGQELGSDDLEKTLSWTDANVLQKFPTLSAFYFPDKKYDALYPTISSVNTWRVVLNQYLGGQLPLLPDKNYMFADYYALTGQVDATERVQKLINGL